MHQPSIPRWRRWVSAGACAIFLVPGCGGDTPKAPEKPAPEAAKERAPAPSTAERALETVGVELTVASPLDEPKLTELQTQSQERFTSGDPGLEVLLLGYADAKAAAVALPTLTSWANRSEVMHKAEGMAEGSYVILVGLEAAAEPTDDTRAVVNKLLNTFVANASRW